ncbi:MAG: cytochrome c-type biogenesis protein CcmH [Solirubrobacterales bacterium]|nr:cytochrome c-type biogenesis protein CcmH [Solirubrobacterales bacterium]
MISRVLIIVAATLALAAPAVAATPRTNLTDVEDEVMCITCNVPLNVAESVQADRQRALIRDYIDQGLTKQQIKDRLVEQYGRNVLALPEDNGFGLAAYLVPIGVALGLLAAAFLLLPRWRRRAPAPIAAGDGPQLSAAEAARLDEDLARYEA